MNHKQAKEDAEYCKEWGGEPREYGVALAYLDLLDAVKGLMTYKTEHTVKCDDWECTCGSIIARARVQKIIGGEG
jgi:hypothetical protein